MNNKEHIPEYYNDLIVSYFSSKVSEEEKAGLMQWLEKDKAHKKYFDEYHELWLAGKLDWAGNNFNAHDGFSRFKKRVEDAEEENEERAGLYRQISLSLYKIAAIALIAFITGVLAWAFMHKENSAIIAKQDITVPAGSKTRVTLPDGTIVWLNAASKLTYGSDYNQTNREVKLTGEGYFKVAKNARKPFIVNTSSITVQALGTEFNVKSYPEEGIIETTLVEGSVSVNKISGESSAKQVILKPNEKLTFIKKTGKLFVASDSLVADNTSKAPVAREEVPRKEQMIVRTIDPIPYVAWKEDKLIFTGERFEEIKPRLERWYDVSIQVNDPEILTYRFKGSFEKESLEQALEALKLASHFNYKVKKNLIIISK